MGSTIIEINKERFIQNIKGIRSQIQNCTNMVKLCLPIKADAYGHGIVEIAQLIEPYVDYLAVARLDEGAILRQSGITKPILLFGGLDSSEIGELIKNNLEITISSYLEAEELINFCHKNKCIARVHIKIDTGMNRIGINFAEAKKFIDFVLPKSELELVGMYSHLASSDEVDRSFTNRQIDRFTKLVKYVKTINPRILCHIANSGGVCYYPESYFDMVRPGILSYGYFPLHKINTGPLSIIKPCYTLKSKVIFIKAVEHNNGVSYNQLYITKESTYIATIPVGYGDGYRRILSNTGQVLIRGAKYTISGVICMDMFMLDIGKDSNVRLDDEVVLIGRQGNEEILIDDLAKKCQTNIYEILCGFTKRIPRIYI